MEICAPNAEHLGICLQNFEDPACYTYIVSKNKCAETSAHAVHPAKQHRIRKKRIGCVI